MCREEANTAELRCPRHLESWLSCPPGLREGWRPVHRVLGSSLTQWPCRREGEAREHEAPKAL